MCLNEIGLHAQNMITIVGSIVNIFGGMGLHEHLMSTRILTVDNEEDIHMISENYDESGCGLDLDFVNHVVLSCVFHIIGESGLVGKSNRFKTPSKSIMPRNYAWHSCVSSSSVWGNFWA